MKASAEAMGRVSVRGEGLHRLVGLDSLEGFLEDDPDNLGFARVLHADKKE